MIPAHQIYSDRIRKNASYKEAIKKAANAAEIGCQATKKMIPKFVFNFLYLIYQDDVIFFFYLRFY